MTKNGHDDGESSSDGRVTRFPDARERAEFERRRQAANDREPPFGENEPILNLPPAIKILAVLLFAIQAVMALLPEETDELVISNLGFEALRYTGGLPFGWQGAVSPISYMFLHGGWLHLGVNLLTLVAFGAGLERLLGWKKLLALYFSTGVLAAFTHLGVCLAYHAAGMDFGHGGDTLIGASGGISGLFGAVLVMMQSDPRGANLRLVMLAAIVILGSVFFGAYGVPGEGNPVAWTAHIGGFLAGLFLFRPLAQAKFLR